ncbi:MAG: DNA polymerase III subunit gamma/tau [Chthonomonadales bacterium]
MAYLSLYRKYRSQSFDEVIGQHHITTVLQNSIRSGRIAHAYLFCGPRGCGKTSTARLVARALNCLSFDGPTPTPCGTCDMCNRIRLGTAMDVIEMDAASETGIDDVREKIIENAKYAPAEARYKVYIIDEVHDLSLKAFDSLLKTIEEPPPNVIFILATTEIHKVPITIRSRCQRMDFRRGTTADLRGNIKRVLDAEGISYEPGAVAAVALAAEGSFRDSLSLLEQALAFTEGGLTNEAVHASIGTVGPEALDSVMEVVASDDMETAFIKAGELVDSGKDVRQTVVALQMHLRDLLVARGTKRHDALADATPERFQVLKQQAEQFSYSQLLAMLEVLAQTERELRFTNQHRLLLERAFWSILPQNLMPAPATVQQAQPTVPIAQAARPTHVDRPKPEPPAPIAKVPVEIEEIVPDPPDKILEDVVSEPPTRYTDGIDVTGLRRIWPRVMKRLQKVSPSAKSIFTDSVVVSDIDGKHVVLIFPDEWSRSRADKPKGREALETALAGEIGPHDLKIRCILSVDSESAIGNQSGSTPSEHETTLSFDQSGEKVSDSKVTSTSEIAVPELNSDFLALVMTELEAEPASID